MAKNPTGISIENLNLRKKIDKSDVIRTAVLAAESVGRSEISVNIVFVSDRKMRAFNKKYLGHDWPTDVLAFSGESFFEHSNVKKRFDAIFLGDVIISSDTALKNSKFYEVSFQEEIDRYIAHGILHLSGYKDDSREGKESMRKKEDEILRKKQRKQKK